MSTQDNIQEDKTMSFVLQKDFVFKGEEIAKAGQEGTAKPFFATTVVTIEGRNFIIPNADFQALTKSQEQQHAA